MPAQPLGAETLAAFLDGRLGPEERAQVLQAIADSPEDYEAFMEASRTIERLEAERMKTARPVRPPPPQALRQRFSWRVVVPLAAAAGIAVAVTLRSVSNHDFLLTSRLPLPSLVDGLRGNEWEQPGWSIVRGETQMPWWVRDFRLGVRSSDFEVALLSGNDEAQQQAGSDLVSLAAELDAGAPIAALYSRIADSDADSSQRTGEASLASQRLEKLLDGSIWFALGRWTELARLSAMANDRGWFDADGTAVRTLGVILVRMRTEPRSGAVLNLLQKLDEVAHGPRGNDFLQSMRSLTEQLIVTAGQ